MRFRRLSNWKAYVTILSLPCFIPLYQLRDANDALMKTTRISLHVSNNEGPRLSQSGAGD